MQYFHVMVLKNVRFFLLLHWEQENLLKLVIIIILYSAVCTARLSSSSRDQKRKKKSQSSSQRYMSKDRKTSRERISSRAVFSPRGSGATHQCSTAAVLFWCNSMVRSGWLNAVPSQHCSPEAFKHFGDKHRLAVKRATEEKAYQMCSQWAAGCIIRPGPEIRRRTSLMPAARWLCTQQCCVISSGAGCLKDLSLWRVQRQYPPWSPILQWEITAQRRGEEMERGGVWLKIFPLSPFPALFSGGRSQS